jgi:hypothetical protein
MLEAIALQTIDNSIRRESVVPAVAGPEQGQSKQLAHLSCAKHIK